MLSIFKKTKTSFGGADNLFEKSLETARDAVIIIDSKEQIVFWNKAAVDIFGYTKEEVAGKALHSFLVRPQEQKLFAEKFPHFQATGEGAAVGHVSQIVALRKNGEVFPVELSVSANYFEGQWFATGIVRDVTERNEDEEKLRKSESLFATLIETIPIPVFFKDRVGRYLGFNKAYERFLGVTKEKLIGKTVFDINPPELAVVYNTKDDELFNTGGEQKYSAQVKSLDKGLRDVVFNKAVFLDEEGSPAGLVGAILDVTEDKSFQREVELKNTILKTEQEVSLDAILTIDENSKITSYNHKFISMFNLSPEMITVGADEPLLQMIAGQNRNPEAFRERVQYLYTHHDEKSRDEMELKDGRVIDRYSAPMIGQGDIYRGRVWYLRDITDQKIADIEHKATIKHMECMDSINRAIKKAEDLDQMMRSVLDAVLSVFDCDRAWLVTPCDPWTLSYRVAMERTKPEWPGASSLGIEVPIDPDTTILFQTTRAADGPVVFDSESDPPLPSEITKHFQVQSQLVMEVHPRVEQSWMIGMHQCSYERKWTEEDKMLFQEIGRRISDALTTLLMHRELKMREEEYSRIINTTVEGILTLNKDHNLTYVNPRMLKMLGYTQKEMLGHKFEEFILPEEMADHEHQMEERRKGNATVYERRFRHKDGSVIWCNVSGTPILNDKKEYDGSFGMVTDITDRKYAEQELFEKDKLSDSLVRFSRNLEQAQTYGEALKAAQDEIKTVVGYTNVWAYRLDENKEYAYSIAATGSSADIVMSDEGTAKLKITGDPMMEAIANTKEIVIVPDAQIDPHVNREIVAKMGNRTLVNVPVILFDRNLGSIGMGTFGDEGVKVPTESEQEYLVAMASHMAVAFDRIRLLNERKK